MKMSNTEKTNVAEWIPKVTPKIDQADYSFLYEENTHETPYEKLVRKCKETPTVPIGILATIGALTYGVIQLKRGNSRQQQYAMRARVTFQGFTLLAIVYSMYIQGKKSLNKVNERKS